MPEVKLFARRDRHAVRDLIFRSARLHTHLDWMEIDDWLDDPHGLIALSWEGERLLGVLALSPPLYGASWLRLLTLADAADVETMVQAMWAFLLGQPDAMLLNTVAVLAQRDWMLPTLERLGFAHAEQIVTLRRPPLELPTLPTAPGLTLRLLHSSDLDAVTHIDHLAFAPPWQMERRDLRQAERITSIGLAALIDGEMVGYALCTLFFEGAHLARLGVLPDRQRRGIASRLIADALARFERRGIGFMSVNTQASNARSLSLYQRFGFALTGNDIPVWTIRLTAG